MATSGGRDSTALLHATARAAAEQGVRVVALHVHHGLQPAADGWVHHLRRQVQRWRRAGVPVSLDVSHLPGAPGPADSVEAWARQHRYRALAAMATAHGAGIVLLAHHRRDQAETVLLQAMRGAGAAGLSAMPVTIERGGIVWARPWLNQPREAIEAYVQRHRLRWVEDPSNQDERFARNRLRHAVWPALTQAFPQAERALSAVADQAQRLAQLQSEVALADLRGLCRPGGSLDVAAWLQLGEGRRWASLHRWLGDTQGRGVSDRALQRLLDALPCALHGQWPADDGLGSWRLFRGVLSFLPSGGTPAGDVPAAAAWPPAGPFGTWRVPGSAAQVRLEAVEQGGLPWERVQRAVWRPRSGGERCSLAPGRPSRPLKLQFQALAVPPWLRDAPLLWDGDDLLWVPTLGADARALAADGAPQVCLTWLPGPVKPA